MLTIRSKLQLSRALTTPRAISPTAEHLLVLRLVPNHFFLIKAV